MFDETRLSTLSIGMPMIEVEFTSDLLFCLTASLILVCKWKDDGSHSLRGVGVAFDHLCRPRICTISSSSSRNGYY